MPVLLVRLVDRNECDVTIEVKPDLKDGRWVGSDKPQHFVKHDERWNLWECTRCFLSETKLHDFLRFPCAMKMPTPEPERAQVHSGPAAWLCGVYGEDGHVCGEPEPKESILEEAQRLVTGDRQEAYSHPKHDFATTAKFWKVYIDRRIESGHELFQPEDVAAMMMLLKLSREAHRHKRDSLVDIAGYAQCQSWIAGD